MEEMSERELWRKAFSAIGLVEELIGSIGGDRDMSSAPSFSSSNDSYDNPYG